MTVTRQTIQRLAEENEQSIPLLEPKCYDSALIGYQRDGFENIHAVYSYDKLINAIYENVNGNKPTEESDITDAIEWFEYNTQRSIGYMGENAPVIVWENDDEE